MWSDSLFQIPEYINEFELKHFCFGEGDSSGGSTSDEDQMPDVQFAPDPTPAMDNANNPNSPSAGYVGGLMPAPASFGYSRGYDPETNSLMPVFDSTRADSEFERDDTRGQEVYGKINTGLGLGLGGMLLAPFTMGGSVAAELGGFALGKAIDNALGTTHTVSNFLGLTEEELGVDPNFELSLEARGLPAAEETTEARNEIASAADGIGFVGDDMPEGPSELIPVAPVSAMQRVPTIQQQQIAEALLQPRQGRAGRTRAGVLGPIYNV